MNRILLTVLLVHAVHCVEIGRHTSCAARRSRMRLVDTMKKKFKRTQKCHVTPDNMASFCFMLECGYCSSHGHLMWKSAMCYQTPCLIANSGAPGLVFASDSCSDDIGFCKLPSSVKKACDTAKKGYEGRLGDRCQTVQAFISEGQGCSSQESTRGFFTQWLNAPVEQDQYLVRQLQPFSAPLVPVAEVFAYEPDEQPLGYHFSQGQNAVQSSAGLTEQLIPINSRGLRPVHQQSASIVPILQPTEATRVLPISQPAVAAQHVFAEYQSQPMTYQVASIPMQQNTMQMAQVNSMQSMNGHQRDMHHDGGALGQVSDDNSGTMKLVIIFVVVCIVAAGVYFMAVK